MTTEVVKTFMAGFKERFGHEPDMTWIKHNVRLEIDRRALVFLDEKLLSRSMGDLVSIMGSSDQAVEETPQVVAEAPQAIERKPDNKRNHVKNKR